MKTALTIAGSDPTGGAGLQADLRVFFSYGLHGLSVPSSLTVQNTRAVDSVEPVSKDLFERQLDFLLRDIRPDALKTGMLYSAYCMEITAMMHKRYSLKNLVIDPVTVSSSGKSLVEDGALEIMGRLLFPLARVVTPNIYEATVFTGIAIESVEDMESAAKALKEMGPEVAIVTGGHLDEITIDVFFDGKSLHRLESPKISGDYHGTGCAFSASITALLALGHTPLEAIGKTKEFMQKAIKRAYHQGSGMGILNFWE